MPLNTSTPKPPSSATSASTEAEQFQAERVADHWWRLERFYKAETSLFSNRIAEVAAPGTSAADGIATLFVVSYRPEDLPSEDDLDDLPEAA
jgi:hypothetical protein